MSFCLPGLHVYIQGVSQSVHEFLISCKTRKQIKLDYFYSMELFLRITGSTYIEEKLIRISYTLLIFYSNFKRQGLGYYAKFRKLFIDKTPFCFTCFILLCSLRSSRKLLTFYNSEIKIIYYSSNI